MVSIKPLAGTFGVEIQGVDLNKDTGDDTIKLLTQALYDSRLIVIRRQQLNKDTYLNFGRQWGIPIPHVLDHIRMKDYPEMLVVGNTEEKDKQEVIRNGAALWHTDQSYEQIPASATMLYSIKVPQSGGATQFCNMVAAYDDLDDATKARIDDLQIAHKYGKGRRRADELVVNPIVNDEQDRQLPPVYHPMVLPHPVSGRKALYALGHGAYGIRGMDDAAAATLIEQLKEHALQEKYIYRHRYQVGDIAIWDTLQTMHSATPIDVAAAEHADNARILWRISVRGKPRIYQ
jgi:alpha-ketoglutarate-dependent taurine dioxygenase